MAQRPDDIPNIRMGVSGQAESVVQIGQAGTVNQYITRTHPPITPRQLPATSSHFLNRTEELAALNAIIEVDESRPAPRVILLDGEMGVGRTNLATRWGRPLKDRFPHGTIYCDIERYRHADTVNLIEVLTKLLRSLQVPEDTMFGDIEGQVDLWRSVTDELSLLVVFDNLEEPAHLEYLSPASPTSTVLVITDKNRAQFVAEGAEHVAVGPFTVDHSLTLLSRVCGRQRLDQEPGEARELVKLCQGRPSTVSAVGTQLRSAPELTLAALLRKLTVEAAPLEPQTIEMIAKRAVVASLDESSQELYRRLRHHPGGGFPTELATALSGDSDAESGLRSLEAKQLVSPDGPGWWRLVDHTPDETGAHADEIRAIMDWHLRVAQLADVAILGPHRLRVLPLEDDPPPNAPSLETVGQALDWLDTDVANLVALAQYAVDRGWDRRVVMVQQSLWALYLHRRHPGYWDITARLAIQAAQRIGDPVIESRMRAERGRYLHEKNLRTGRFDEALDELEQARRLAVEALDGTETNDRLGRRLEASATEMAGRIHYTQQRYDEALTAFRFACQVNRELGLPRAEALMRQFIAGVYLATGRLQDALSLMLKAREVFLLLDAERDEARLLIELADLWGRLGDVEQALLTFNTAAKRLFDCQMFLHLAKAMELRGDLCHEQGFAAEAREAWQQALRIHNEQNNGAGADAKRLAEKLAN